MNCTVIAWEVRFAEKIGFEEWFEWQKVKEEEDSSHGWSRQEQSLSYL